MTDKKCPFCGETIKTDALKCRYCREWVDMPDYIAPEDIPETIDESLFGIEQSYETRVPHTPQALPNENTAEPSVNTVEEKTKLCPFCQKEIKIEAWHCVHCGEWFETNRDTAPKSNTSDKWTSQSDYSPIFSDEKQLTSHQQPQIETNDIPRLKRQNFFSGMFVSALLIILILKGFQVKYLSDTVGNLTLTQVILVITGFILCERLLYILSKYMRNFNISKNFRPCMLTIRIIMYSYWGGAFIIQFLFPSLTGIFYGLTAVIALTAAILFALCGKHIKDLGYEDYVGGCPILGNLMLFGIIFPFVWLGFPAVTFYVFWKARSYSKEYGFDGD